MQRSNSVRLKIASFSLYSSLFLVSVSGLLLPGAAMAQATNEPVIYLDQAWWQDDREWYYHFSQGSAVLSYDIFMNLEAACSQRTARATACFPSRRTRTIRTGCRSSVKGQVGFDLTLGVT